MTKVGRKFLPGLESYRNTRWFVELGCGHYSTPILSQLTMSFGPECFFKVYYKNKEWVKTISSYCRAFLWLPVVDWESLNLDPNTLLVFIDREVDTTNKERAVHLHNGSFQEAGIVVVHDWNTINDESAKKNFKYFRLFDYLTPTTAVFSNYFELDG
jgi:hypothetical protein